MSVSPKIASLTGRVADTTTISQLPQPITLPRYQYGEIDIAVQGASTSAFNLTGYTLILAVRSQPGDSTPILSKQATIVSASAGTAYFPIVTGDTTGSTILPGPYQYDVWMTDGAGAWMQIVPTSLFTIAPSITQPNGSVTVAASQQPLAPGPGYNVFNVKDYGALGTTVVNSDGSTVGPDDAPAFRLCFAAAQAAHGGTIYVPPGKYKISSADPIGNGYGALYQAQVQGPVVSSDSVVFRGEGSLSQIYPANSAITLFGFNCNNVVRDLTIVGDPTKTGAGQVDCVDAFSTQGALMPMAITDNVQFIGLRTSRSHIYNALCDSLIQNVDVFGPAVSTGGSIFLTQLTSRTIFRGLRAYDSAGLNGVIYARVGLGVDRFILAKTPAGSGSQGDSLAESTVTIQDCNVDEGMHPIMFEVTGGATRHTRVLIENCNGLMYMDASANMALIQQCDHVTVRNCGSWVRDNHTSFVLVDAGHVTFDGIRLFGAGTKTLFSSDSATPSVTMIDCVFDAISPNAATQVIVENAAGVRTMPVYTTVGRPAASSIRQSGAIWNSTTKKPNYSDGSTNWYDAMGNIV